MGKVTVPDVWILPLMGLLLSFNYCVLGWTGVAIGCVAFLAGYGWDAWNSG